ncbi:hypothetical protein [Devosia sediminis]|uniref:Uncharacterized protein n=1 Tax=Devosia sediminis TaxID=2798801 RepID=A0A934IUR5_9HYPH|nr:hypothetical protein [Devosia sediminis]MBJ3783431.1 hypothetical protein [Devosia sediminis]
MTTIGSNQYPRLPWRPNPEPVHGGFIAEPHGPGAGHARVYYDRDQIYVGTWWVWVAVWEGRFSEHGFVCAATSDLAKQAAADAATVAYWNHIEETEGWVKPPPPRPPAFDYVEWHFWRRFEDWLWNRATIEEVLRHMGRCTPQDRAIRQRLADAYASRLNFGFDSSRPPGKRGLLAELRAAG